TEKVLKDLAKHGLDAINIDIKGDKMMVQKYCNANVGKVWRNAKLSMDLGIHTEITILIIEDFNSGREIIRSITDRVVRELSPNTAVHLNRFFPHFKSANYGLDKPTDLKLMERSYEIAKDSPG
ncbi:MAG: hypothetical protein R6U27_13135, partial [Desulfobacterales bacterium]